jgi:hypothetical protein
LFVNFILPEFLIRLIDLYKFDSKATSWKWFISKMILEILCLYASFKLVRAENDLEINVLIWIFESIENEAE